MKQEEYQKPNLFVYQIGKIIGWYFNHFVFHLEYKRNELKDEQGPCVVLAGHSSSYDQFGVGLATKRKITFVLGKSMFYTVPFIGFVKGFRTINKDQFQTRIPELKAMRAVVKAGEILAIFPTGICSNDGESTYLPEATGKFVKSLGVNVYIAKLDGIYISNPKWSKVLRKGKVEANIYKLYTAEDIKSLSSEEIYAGIDRELHYDNYEWQEQAQVVFQNGDNVIGLENVLHSCPVCLQKHSIQCRGQNTLFCEKCGFEEVADTYGFLHNEMDEKNEIRHISAWGRLIREQLKDRIRQDDHFQEVVAVNVTRLDREKRRFVSIGDGKVSVDRQELKVTLNASGESEPVFCEKTLDFSSLPMIPGKYFDLQNGMDTYRCFTHEPKDASYIMDVVRCIFEMDKEREEA